jgi:hypothetical protein
MIITFDDIMDDIIDAVAMAHQRVLDLHAAGRKRRAISQAAGLPKHRVAKIIKGAKP